ncbi:MAG: hypothetical protein R2711_10605 [Acidimicrobiales bacterium]
MSTVEDPQAAAAPAGEARCPFPHGAAADLPVPGVGAAPPVPSGPAVEGRRFVRRLLRVTGAPRA